MAKTEMSDVAGMNSCTVEGLREHLQDMLFLDQPTFIQGSSGIGKSDIVRQACEAEGYALYDRRASQMLPEDFSGIPLGDLATKSTERCIPDIVAEVTKFNIETGKPVCLFLDELNLGSQQVLSAAYELVLDRRAGNFMLPDGTRIICAGNRSTDGASVVEVPRPLLNRMSVVHFKGPTFDEWADWAIDNAVHPMVLTALKVAPDFLHGHYNAEQERNPTPRSWAYASDALARLDTTNRGDNRILRLLRLSSYVGDEAALKVQSIYDVAGKLFDPRTIFTNPASIGAHDNLALGYLQMLQLSNLVSNVAQTKASFAWVERCHPEMMAVLVHGVMRRHNAMTLEEKKKGGLVSDAALIAKISSYNKDYMTAGDSLKA